MLSAAAVGLAFTLPAAAAPDAGHGAAPSAAELAGVVSVLNERADTVPASVTGWYADEATGAVVVTVLGSDPAAPKWLAGAGDVANKGLARIERVTEAPVPLWEIRGGQPLYLPGGGRCTVGFNARSGNTRLVITAGHCVTSQGTYHGVGGPIGPPAGSVFPGQMDAGLIRVTYNEAESTPYVGNYVVAGAQRAPVGTTVCKLGSTTGLTCGTIQTHNATVCYPQGCVWGMSRANFCAEPGDSGAPVFTPTRPVQAQGVVSGGSGNCRTGGVTYYQPLDRILSSWGLTLYTG